MIRILEWVKARMCLWFGSFWGEMEMLRPHDLQISPVIEPKTPTPPESRDTSLQNIPISDIDVTPERKLPSKKLQRSKARGMCQSLSGLLDEIENTFESLTRKANGGSFTHQSVRQGLRQMGPYVPMNFSRHDAFSRRDAYNVDGIEPKISVNPQTKFSSLIFVAYNGGRFNNDKWMYPDFSYASRLKKLPWDVEPLPGIAYECGLAFRSSSSRLYWIGFYVAIDPETGVVRACHELIHKPIDVRGKGSYCRREWGVSQFAIDEWGKDEAARNDYLAKIFAKAFTFWQEKEQMWSVGVRRSGYRVTFCVDPTNTKSFFRDRDKLVLTPTGKRKPIIHCVSEHQRQLTDGREATIKEHIRGLRRFNWRGFECAVTAPKFHRFTTQCFDIPAELEEDMEVVPKELIYVDRLGSILANLEDSQQPIKQQSRH